jgi:hypothetical protein
LEEVTNCRQYLLKRMGDLLPYLLEGKESRPCHLEGVVGSLPYLLMGLVLQEAMDALRYTRMASDDDDDI